MDNQELQLHDEGAVHIGGKAPARRLGWLSRQLSFGYLRYFERELALGKSGLQTKFSEHQLGCSELTAEDETLHGPSLQLLHVSPMGKATVERAASWADMSTA